MASIPVIILAFANDQKGELLRSIAEEHRNIKEALSPLQDKGLIKLVDLPNAQAKGIYKAFRAHKDQVKVFHYGGHADGLRLMLNASEQGMDVAAFSEYLAEQKGIELVFMNACTTASQKKALQATNIPSLILTHEAIGDEAAQHFAREFYQNLASGRIIKRSFHEASAAAKSQSETLFRGFEREEEKKVYELPWLLSQKRASNWKLSPKAPPKWGKISAIGFIGLFFIIGGYLSWAYILPFDLKIPIKFPEGVKEKHFAYKHELRFILETEVKEREIESQDAIMISNVKGIEGKVKVEIQSPLWTLERTDFEVSRKPDYISLVWISKLSKIPGRIEDEDENPISGAKVFLEGSSVSTISGNDGKFTLNIPQERIGQITYKIQSQKEGYENTNHMVNLSDPQQEYLVFMEKERL